MPGPFANSVTVADLTPGDLFAFSTHDSSGWLVTSAAPIDGDLVVVDCNGPVPPITALFTLPSAMLVTRTPVAANDAWPLVQQREGLYYQLGLREAAEHLRRERVELDMPGEDVGDSTLIPDFAHTVYIRDDWWVPLCRIEEDFFVVGVSEPTSDLAIATAIAAAANLFEMGGARLPAPRYDTVTVRSLRDGTWKALLGVDA